MKVRPSVKPMCEKCKIIRRHGAILVICIEPPPQAEAGVRPMARIAGINIPLNKRAEIGLTYIYGIGRSTANELLDDSRASRRTPTSAT